MVLPMNLSPKGQIEICSYEGLCQKIYYDSGGVKTLGFGSTITEIPNINKMSLAQEHSIVECVDIFKKSIPRYVDPINKYLTRQVSQTTFDAMVSLAYNIGVGALPNSQHGPSGLLGSTFFRWINEGQNLEKCAEALKRYKYDNGKVVTGLVNRRAAEARLMITGQYASDGKIEWRDTDNKGHQTTRKTIDISSYFLEPSTGTVEAKVAADAPKQVVEEKKVDDSPPWWKKLADAVYDSRNKK